MFVVYLIYRYIFFSIGVNKDDASLALVTDCRSSQSIALWE